MKVLVIGSGGREHAVCQKLRQSSAVDTLYCAPGNGGIAQIAECVPIAATDVRGITDFAVQNGIGFVCVTPDDPLALGLVDALESAHIPAFGPNAAAARIESSKVFCKNLLEKYRIPTARAKVCTDAAAAISYLKDAYPKAENYPVVIKADGLAKGKGVVIANNQAEAQAAVEDMLDKRVFGEAGASLLIEEFLTGPEVSLMCFADGKHLVCMPSAQDHKRVFDGDQGPNTGGMGAFSPSRRYTPEIHAQVLETILLPALRGMEAEGCPFKGVLYAGLMLTAKGPMTLEFNARFGDPETQVILPLLKTDLLAIMTACRNGTLDTIQVAFENRAAAVVVMASHGYPGKNRTGDLITGIETVQNATVYQAGTRASGDSLYTDGGRVLGVSATGESLEEALAKAYDGVSHIRFDGAHYRTDIGIK